MLMHHLIQSNRKKDRFSKILSYIFKDQSTIKYTSSLIDSTDGNIKHWLKIRLKKVKKSKLI